MIAPQEISAAPPPLLDRVRWHLRVKRYSIRSPVDELPARPLVELGEKIFAFKDEPSSKSR